MENKTSINHENGNSTKPLVSGTFICDVCDCEHEMNYKCVKCSGKAYINTHEDVFGDITSEWTYSGDVCGNCCNCH